MTFNLIVCIVPRNSGEVLCRASYKEGANGGTISMGRGTASNSFLQMIGFGDSSKDLVYVLTDSSKTKEIEECFITACEDKKRPFGIMFAVDVSSFIKTSVSYGEINMNFNTTHKLITIIVNKGYADDAMDAARKAGATGGTIIGARGTARPDDDKFFGVEIVPEKDMIFILCDNDKSESILEAIKNLDCLSKPGSGIAFTCPASDFTLLGKKK